MTNEVAYSIYGKSSLEQKAVQNAWNAVGIKIK